MPTTFITAAQAEKQVTSHQARLSHAHTFGEGRYLLDGLKLTMETSNRLKAGAGVMLIDGSYVTVDEAGQEWTVENGAQAMKRIDLAGYEYSVGEDGMELLAPKVLKGTPHATAPTMPTYAKGSLLDRPAKLFVPIAKVELDGISAKQPTCMLEELPTIAGLRDSVSASEDPTARRMVRCQRRGEALGAAVGPEERHRARLVGVRGRRGQGLVLGLHLRAPLARRR